MKLYAPSTIKDIKEKYGFRFSKSLGQNFLTDKNVIDKIIEGSGINSQDVVIEIGPGIGVITCEAAKIAKKVYAVEIDKNLIPILRDTLGNYNNVEILNQDILETDINELTSDAETDNIKILGNLPYYITTPIIMKLLEENVKARSITIMMQKEVADRIKANPGTKAYGAISVAVQYYCIVSEITSVPRSAFVPQPSVDSSVIRLELRDNPPVELDDRDLFFKCVKAGFGQRRKTLSNSLMTLEGIGKYEIMESLSECRIDPRRRGETLSIVEFAALSNSIYKKKVIK